MKKFICLFLVMISTNSFGQVISLICIDKVSNYLNNVDFDESNQTVTTSNKTMKGLINQNEVFWRELGTDGKVYFGKLNRSTGTLQIIDSLTKTIDSTYDCQVRVKKF